MYIIANSYPNQCSWILHQYKPCSQQVTANLSSLSLKSAVKGEQLSMSKTGKLIQNMEETEVCSHSKGLCGQVVMFSDF